MSNTPSSFACYVGIDWANNKHDIAIVDEHGKVTHVVIEHSTEAIDAWVSKIQAQTGGRPIAIMLEQAKGALIHALMLRDNLFLYPVNPTQFANYRKSFQTTSAKDDKSDALLLARLLFERHRDMRPWCPDDENTRLLNRLCEARRKWVDQRTSLAQQLLDQVKCYFPALLSLSSEKLHECRLLLEILLKWADPREFNRAHPKTLAKLFSQHGYRNPEQQKQLIDAIKLAKLHTQDMTLLRVASLSAAALARQILNCQDIVGKLDQEIKEAMKKHPDAALFSGLRGAGDALAPRLLTAFGSDRERFQSAEQVASYCGIAPVTKQSGKSRQVVRRRACNKYLLQTFHEFAKSAAIWSLWSKAFYRLQQGKGMKHHAILRKLAYKWIRILFQVWKTKTPFDEAKYINSLTRKNPEIIPFLEKLQKTA